MDLPILPPEIALAEEPFSEDDLSLAIAAVDRTEWGPADLVALGPDEPVYGAEDLGEEERPTVERVARWRPQNDQEAEWAARNLRKAKGALATAAELAAEWNRQISGWLQTQIGGPERSIKFFEAILEDYGIRQRELTAGDRKTITLPSATIRTRPVAAKAVVADGKDQEFIAWAREYLPELVRAKPTAALSEFSKHLRIEEIVDHYDWVARYECEHTQTGVAGADATLGDKFEGILPDSCPYCEPDPIDGAPERMVVQAECWPVTRLAVTALIPNPDLDDLDGRDDTLPEEVDVEPPGLTIEPGTTKASVST